MITLKHTLAICFAALLAGGVMAQPKLSYTEFGAAVSSLNYSGDIATNASSGSMLTEARPSFSLYIKRHTNDWFAMGFSLGYGWFYANDDNHDNPERGLEVWTSMTQINADIEVNLIRYGKFHLERKFGLYLKAGGGFLAYSPHLTLNNNLPLNVELYDKGYSTGNFFGGLGVKFRTSDRSTLRIEGTFHSTGSDHLDGFQLIGESVNSDTYKSLTVGYSILVF